MNIRITWVLFAALCASLAVLLYPAQEQRPADIGSELQPQGEAPRLTILDAEVQTFDADGTPSWAMHSPEIAYFRDGRLGVVSPRVLLRSESGSRLEVRAGRGALMPAPLQDTLELSATVNAKIRGDRSELDFTTQKLHISRDGKLVTAPQPIRLRSSSGETTAARLDLDLEDQVLLLGSTARERVVTRLQPERASQ